MTLKKKTPDKLVFSILSTVKKSKKRYLYLFKTPSLFPYFQE